MRRVLSILICLTFMIVLAGCQGKTGDPNYRDETAYVAEEGFAESLKSDYLSFRKKYPEMKNDVCFYVNAQNQMPDNREVKLCFTDMTTGGWREAGTLEITANDIKVAEEQYIFSFGKHFPVNIVTAMTGCASVNDLFDKIGQVQTYAELGDFCAFSVNRYDKRPNYVDTVYFGTTNDVRSVDIGLGEFSQPPDNSLQITDEYINYFAYDYGDMCDSSIVIAQIPRSGGEVVTKTIRCANLGLPALLNVNFSENIFIDGDYLFFLSGYVVETEPEVVSEFYITTYDLKTDKFDVYKTRDVKGMGKLFRCSNGLGVTTVLYDKDGYFSDMGVRFLNLDEKNCKLSFNKDILFAQSGNWAYDMGLSARDFYCIGDKLCGVLTYKANGAMFEYVEIDLKNGAVTTCVPFAKNDKSENKSWVYGSVIIRDNGKGVSQHNCS